MSATVVPVNARCLDCNYALRGLADFRCPECDRGHSTLKSTCR